MNLEQRYAQDLVRSYESEGWTALESSSAKDELGFEPDLVFRRDAENLVVEIKREGKASSRALSLIRKIVETRPGWKFELKFVPSSYDPITNGNDHPWLPERLRVARRLQKEGLFPEAFMIAWTVLEAVLREKIVRSGRDGDIEIARLLRDAYEEDHIEDADRRLLETAQQIRNRIVHGYDVGDVGDRSRALIDLTERLIEKGP